MIKRLAVLLALLTLLGGFTLWSELRRPFRGYSGNIMVQINPGTRAPEVASILVERGVLARRWPFLVRYVIGRPRHHLRAGEYLFDRPLRPLDVYRKLVQGEVYLHLVVIPEGSDRFDIARIVQEQLGIDPQKFLQITELPSPIRDLDPRAPTLEGYLFPDTYRFPRGVSPNTVVSAMLARFRRIMNSKLNEDLSKSRLSLRHVITLASLVEKETPDPRERPTIAGVFMKRLKLGWPLQCDPTVIYAARLNRRFIGSATEPITQSDLNFDSPYNTYRHAGLPPGPISNPGEASIRAALDAAPGDLLYFVSNNLGGHIFARTLAEHQRNVARYRRRAAEVARVVNDRSQQRDRENTVPSASATTHSAKRAKQANQKRKDHGVLPGSRSRVRGTAGNPGD